MRFPVQNPIIKNGVCLNISQFFGENVQIYGGGGHPGLDFVYLNPDMLPGGVSSYGKPVLSICAGKVVRVIWNNEHSLSGNGVIVRTDKYEIVYWHFSKIDVIEGQNVDEGEQLGEMGNSGWVFPVPNLSNEDPNDDKWGTHCHLELKEHINGVIQNVNNGFGGAIDPLPFLFLTQTSMRYVIDQHNNQWLVDDVFNIAFSIPDEKTLLMLKEKGGIQPNQQPTLINSLVRYLVWRGAPDSQFKEFFNL
jgi:murein DD-endopeptidase MepM/ murein hydrolase activator NlpD